MDYLYKITVEIDNEKVLSYSNTIWMRYIRQ